MQNIDSIKQWKIKNLDSKSPSFCGAKWYNASLWLSQGWTTSCHHNPPHEIDLDAIKTNPSALHNTPVKKRERKMMQQGEKPFNCQFCWVQEEIDPDTLTDRTWLSWGGMISDTQLQTAFETDSDRDYDLTYLEICFDRTCNLGCSYCAPAISSTWAKDVRNNGAYINLPTDHRNHYLNSNDDHIKYKFGEDNPYADAFFKWWDTSLHKTIRQLRISGGEPMLSGHTWKLLDWLTSHSELSDFRIELVTNLSYDSDTLMRFLDKCSRISVPIWLYTSGESTGRKMEYIRDGIDWDLWNKNLDTVLDSGVIANTGICATMSAPATAGFVEFLSWLLDRKKSAPSNKSGNLMLSVNPLRFPTFQNIIVLPIEYRTQISHQIENFLAGPEIAQYFLPIEIDHIARFATYLRDMTYPHKEDQATRVEQIFNKQQHNMDIQLLQRDFKSFFTQYDQRRNQNFSTTFPCLKTWYDQI